MAKTVKGYWDCKHCGTTGISGLIRTCPNCGKSRDNNTKFYMKKGTIEYVQPVNDNKPDWICKYCEQLNPASTDTCISCGSVRDEENLDYFENHINKNGNQDFTISHEQVETAKDGEKMYAVQEKDKSSKKSKTYDDETTSSTFSGHSYNCFEEDNTPIKSEKSFSLNSNLLKIFAIVLVALMAIGGLVYLFIPKIADYTIDQTSWKYEIQIERYQTVNENDWQIPSGGRLKYTRSEIHHYEQVLDHYYTETVQVPHTVITGYTYSTSYSDNGNGTFTEHTVSIPEYGTEYTTEVRSVPVYRSEPVYMTKYYYEIDKWLYERSVITSENDKNPYWGKLSLKDDERISNRLTSYFADCVDKKDNSKTFSFSHDDWQMLEVGLTYKLKVSMNDSAEIVNNSEEKFEQE